MKSAAKLIFLFLFTLYSLQLYGVIIDDRITNFDTKVLTSIIIIFQIFFVLLFYLTIINERKQQKKFIVNWELKLILVFLFVTIEIAAVVLFLKEGI
ncbi:hypothetical protein D9X38_RS10825, partial [Escherichia coli]|nr:hypothetical protein [Escherichia coli]EEZ0967006.1 hypothetical protein [Escherichia coli]EIO2265946.1 hypothetical protein [Escherichia coli]MCM5292711.1 hypothetical protein [Escherichia coli]HAH7940653.1 hypothetical protein [Escherichia coli]